MNNDITIGIGYNENGESIFQLNQGPDYDKFKMYLHVNVWDWDGAFTRFDINTPITVIPNNALIRNYYSLIKDKEPIYLFNKELYELSPQKVIQISTSLISMLNSESFSDRNSLYG